MMTRQWLKYKFGGGGTVILAWPPVGSFGPPVGGLGPLVDGRGPFVSHIGISLTAS